ncbi:lactonase family protein [Flammeovirga pacifica]|uniref:6-phosphogluconolactonase n=1 Tax=Flammeovirga pacifica TaxID=915059 RepID=A0A1S1YZA4_FLAPC|nr:lactonase family protein [Flammeovirga pacifica]OHX66263.1 hypothetical protein NH26_07805 [Flammeovirga pacifica]
MKKIFTLLALLITTCSVYAQQVSFLVGTYTDKDSKGVYQVTIEEETGHLVIDGVVIKTENPSYLAYSHNRKYLGVVNEIEDGGLCLYKEMDGQFHLVNRHQTNGSYPCHLSFDHQGNVFVANYGGGNISFFSIEDKKLSDLKQLIQYDKTGPNAARQEASHAHFANYESHSSTVYTVDLGGDEIHAYHVGKKNLEEKFSFQVKPGNGPRHLVENGKYIYVLEELTSKITVMKKNNKGGADEIQEISTLNDDFTGKNTGAAIKMSKDKKYLYASNRGHNSIAIFKIKNNKLVLSNLVDTHGDSPRDFSFSPDEKFVVVANQLSDNITLFERNSETGQLIFKSEAEISSPVNITF